MLSSSLLIIVVEVQSRDIWYRCQEWFLYPDDLALTSVLIEGLNKKEACNTQKSWEQTLRQKMMINNKDAKNIWEKGKFFCAFYRKGADINSI